MSIIQIAKSFLNFFYIYIIHILIKNAFEEIIEIEEDKKIFIVRYIIAYLIIALSSVIIKKPIINLISTYFAIFLISKNYSNEIVNNIYLSLYTHSILLIGEFIGAIPLGYLSATLTNSIFIKTLADLFLLYISCFFTAIIVIKIRKKFKNIFAQSTKIYLIIIPFLSIILIILFYSLNKISIIQLSLSTILLLTINLTTFEIYKHTVKVITLEKNNELIEEQNTFYKNQISLMKESEDIVKSYRHDVKNHLSVLFSLIEQNEKDKAKNYLKEMEKEISICKNYIYSGNDVIDSIINYKLNIAKDFNIEFISEISIKEIQNLSSYEITTIIGNLLDNAISACKKLEEDKRKIILKIKEEKGKLTIYVQNFFDGNIKIENEKFISTKIDKNSHGYGIQNIKKTIEKNKGVCKFKIIDENIFSVLIIFILD